MCLSVLSGKARRLKQAKDEATEEIEKYRQEREKQFKDFETKVFRWLRQLQLLSATMPFCLQHLGTREGVQAKIEKETIMRLDEMNRALKTNQQSVIGQVLDFVYNIEAQIHKNYRQD